MHLTYRVSISALRDRALVRYAARYEDFVPGSQTRSKKPEGGTGRPRPENDDGPGRRNDDGVSPESFWLLAPGSSVARIARAKPLTG